MLEEALLKDEKDICEAQITRKILTVDLFLNKPRGPKILIEIYKFILIVPKRRSHIYLKHLNFLSEKSYSARVSFRELPGFDFSAIRALFTRIRRIIQATVKTYSINPH